MNFKLLGTRLRRYAGDTCGATAIEYGLIGLGIAVVIVASVQALGTDVSAIFTDVDAGLK